MTAAIHLLIGLFPFLLTLENRVIFLDKEVFDYGVQRFAFGVQRSGRSPGSLILGGGEARKPRFEKLRPEQAREISHSTQMSRRPPSPSLG
jgi:hypothetical protein